MHARTRTVNTHTQALIQFLKGPLRFLVGNQLTESALYPGTGIKQGDTLSPTIFSLLTAVLIRKILHSPQPVSGATG